MTTIRANDRPFSELFGGLPGDGPLASLAKHAAKAGYAVMPIRPGSKQPLCTLTSRQAKQADKEAAQAAKEAGRRNWERVRHDCGSAHATTDPDVAHRVFKRLEAEHEDLNIAVEITRSRVLVVDADTAAERVSFTKLWAHEENEPLLEEAAPTVRSPGVVDEDGTWKHKDGGHYWFLLPDDVELGSLAGVTSIPIGVDDDHPAQLKVAGYVLVPPSQREEGHYYMCSDVDIAPEWLIERTQLYLTERRTVREHRRDQALDADDRITLAQSAMTWASILEPRGWELWFKVDRCGCEIWTAPGTHSSPKSATAHDAGCGQFDTTDGFLHLWTDNPPGDMGQAGTKTFSKIQVVAWSDFGGDMAEAMRELGIETGSDERRIMDDWSRQLGEKIREAVKEREREETPERAEKKTADTVSEDVDDEDPEDGDSEEHSTSWWFRDLGPVLSGENPEPEPEILSREDGPRLFYPGKVNGLIGESESGKSWIALAAVAEQLQARRPVLYFDFEDTAPGIVTRLRSLGVSDTLMHPDAELFGYIGPEESLHQLAKFDFADALTFRRWSLVIFDGVNAAMTQVGLDLISNTDATKFFTDVTRPASMTGATVVTIDHVPKNAENRGKGGIGAQAKRASITGACIAVSVHTPFARGRSGKLTLSVDKDRPGYVRAAANASQEWSTAVVNARPDGTLSVNFREPEEVSKDGTSIDEDHRIRLGIMEYLKRIQDEHGGEYTVSKTAVEENVPGKCERIREGLRWLVQRGYVHHQEVGRSHRHRWLMEYPEDLAEIDSEADDAPF